MIARARLGHAALFGLGLALVVCTVWAARDTPAYTECINSIIVDVVPIPGESWTQHTGRMDAVAHRYCKKWL